MQLPHRTGSPSHDFIRDEVVVLTRATLVGVSPSCIGLVVETLVQLLEELARPYKGIQTHPIHVLHSELYALELLADCCATHWDSRNTSRGRRTDTASGSDTENSHSEDNLNTTSAEKGNHGHARRISRNRPLLRDVSPEPLDDELVKRLVDAIKLFLRPLSDNYVLPATNILDDVFKGLHPAGNPATPDSSAGADGHLNGTETSKILLERNEAIEAFTRGLVEYVSFSNWPKIFECLKNSLRAAHPTAGSTVQASLPVDDDRSALITLRLISSFWIDGRKLSIVIQELCGSFLHLRKAFQTTIAIALPLLITRWLERSPAEFVDLHTMHKRLDGGAETLFDMSNTMFDGGRRKSLLFPFQTCLLFLLPDVFEVASNMRDVKSSSISKKVSFLEMLRKSLRNRNEPAIFCLTSVLRVARHFTLDSDAAILSYALDVQEEIRESVFRKYTIGMDTTAIDSGLMTAAFVSLAHLNFETCVENLAPFCLAHNSPQDFKIAVISACSHFARQENAADYQPLFSTVAEFVRTQLKVPFLSFNTIGI
jgi:neurofibromin 1